jgi:hypothetical protein
MGPDIPKETSGEKLRKKRTYFCVPELGSAGGRSAKGATMKPIKLTRLKGILCRGLNGEYFLRTTDPNGETRDYTIHHSDLAIEILDEDAYAYQRDEEWFIDHGPATLGIESSSSESA